MGVEYGEYRGEPFMSISNEETGAFQTKVSFGKKKARLILKHLKEIRKFAADTPPENRT